MMDEKDPRRILELRLVNIELAIAAMASAVYDNLPPAGQNEMNNLMVNFTRTAEYCGHDIAKSFARLNEVHEAMEESEKEEKH